MIQKFFLMLKENMEQHSAELRRGKAFLPEYLKGKRLTRQIFPNVAESLASSSGLELETEVLNPMPKEYGLKQRVDFVFNKDKKNLIFMELETLDRSQIYLFRDYKGLSEDNNDNKLRYYKATLEKKLKGNKDMPKYFVFLLILPDQKVTHYQIWDRSKYYKFFHSSLKKVIRNNPYRFYDGMIKSSAQLLLEQKLEFSGKRIADLQNVCELALITCTVKELVLSRGKNFFNPEAEIRKAIKWR